jgi:ABC-type lipoprotein export system ATPase subunit
MHKKILLARSIIHKPKILFYEDPTDTMDEKLHEIIGFITAEENKWTIIVSSKPLLEKQMQEIIMQNGRIQTGLKKI